jgi:uncharacterized membrane protein (DUF106 family)
MFFIGGMKKHVFGGLDRYNDHLQKKAKSENMRKLRQEEDKMRMARKQYNVCKSGMWRVTGDELI